MTLPKRSCRQTIIALSIATAFLSGSLAFQTAPATRTRLYSHHRPTHIIQHGHQPIHFGTSGKILMASARSDEGHDDWCIDEDDGSDTISRVIESPSELDDGKKDDDIRTYFATCIPGLHHTLASELIALGAERVETQGKSGVRFKGSPKVGLKSILWCRTAHKIMELIASSSEPTDECDFSQGIINKDDLYQFTKSAVHTPTLLGDGRGGLLTLSVSTIYASKAPSKELCHGHFTALTVKNAMVDSVRDLRDDGDRPNVDVEDSDVPLVVVIRGRPVDDGRGGDWRRGRGSYGETYEEEEFVADVDLYRCLHSGGSLHRRGYRSGNGNLDSDWGDEEIDRQGEREANNRNRRSQNASVKAPIHKAAMKESLAAGLLLEAGWDKLIHAARGDGKGAVLVDPMTGSGTLPTEAALIACDMAPGLLRIAAWRGDQGRNNPHRSPPCVRWKDFSSNVEVWDELVADATQRAKTGMKWARSSSESGQKNVKILGNEKNPRAFSLAQSSVRTAGVGAMVSLSEGDCVDWDLGGGDATTNNRDVIEGRTMFVCNPPWGLRLTEDIDESWVSLREFLRLEAGGCESWVLSGNKDLTKILRMKKSRTVVVKTADEDLRWLQYHIFQKRPYE